MGTPLGEGLRANAAGRLPRSPSRPSGRLCRRAPQQRRLLCAVGVSASLGKWGPLRPGPGMRGGQPRSQDPTSRAPQPAPPRPSWDSSHPWRCQPWAAPRDREALSRVLTAEWPAPGSSAQSVPGAPSRRDLAPNAGRTRRGLRAGVRGGLEGMLGRVSRIELFLLFWAPGVFAEKTEPSSSLERQCRGWPGGRGTWRNAPAQRIALPPPR